MQDPMNTSSILSPATSDNNADASELLGKTRRMGSLISSILTLIVAAYSIHQDLPPQELG
jgi:hypothetical protein